MNSFNIKSVEKIAERFPLIRCNSLSDYCGKVETIRVTFTDGTSQLQEACFWYDCNNNLVGVRSNPCKDFKPTNPEDFIASICR